MIKTIIIDDEPAAVNVLSLLLKKYCSDDVQVVATTNSPVMGKALIQEHHPDLVFLDIEMPGITGIDIIRSFVNPQFHFVFITAYDAYAVEAFRLSAIDYILKPLEEEDIIKVIKKVKKDKLLPLNTPQEQFEKLQQLLQSGRPDTKIAIGMADKIMFIYVNEILYLEAAGSYTNIFIHDGKKLVASKLLGDFESQLSSRNFFRIHHSFLINLKKVKEFQRHEGGYVVMDNDKKLEVSQRRRKEFLIAISDFVI